MKVLITTKHMINSLWDAHDPSNYLFTPIATAVRERMPGFPRQIVLLATTVDRKFVRFFPRGFDGERIDVKLPSEAQTFLKDWKSGKFT